MLLLISDIVRQRLLLTGKGLSNYQTQKSDRNQRYDRRWDTSCKDEYNRSNRKRNSYDYRACHPRPEKSQHQATDHLDCTK